MGRAREEKRRAKKIGEEKESEERRCMCAKRWKSRDSLFFSTMICGSGGSKSRLPKAVGVEPCGEMRDEQLHAMEVQSTFGNQKVQIISFWEHFWKLRCRKHVQRCGAKHMSK